MALRANMLGLSAVLQRCTSSYTFWGDNTGSYLSKLPQELDELLLIHHPAIGSLALECDMSGHGHLLDRRNQACTMHHGLCFSTALASLVLHADLEALSREAAAAHECKRQSMLNASTRGPYFD